MLTKHRAALRSPVGFYAVFRLISDPVPWVMPRRTPIAGWEWRLRTHGQDAGSHRVWQVDSWTCSAEASLVRCWNQGEVWELGWGWQPMCTLAPRAAQSHSTMG